MVLFKKSTHHREVAGVAEFESDLSPAAASPPAAAPIHHVAAPIRQPLTSPCNPLPPSPQPRCCRRSLMRGASLCTHLLLHISFLLAPATARPLRVPSPSYLRAVSHAVDHARPPPHLANDSSLIFDELVEAYRGPAAIDSTADGPPGPQYNVSGTFRGRWRLPTTASLTGAAAASPTNSSHLGSAEPALSLPQQPSAAASSVSLSSVPTAGLSPVAGTASVLVHKDEGLMVLRLASSNWTAGSGAVQQVQGELVLQDGLALDTREVVLLLEGLYVPAAGRLRAVARMMQPGQGRGGARGSAGGGKLLATQEVWAPLPLPPPAAVMAAARAGKSDSMGGEAAAAGQGAATGKSLLSAQRVKFDAGGGEEEAGVSGAEEAAAAEQSWQVDYRAALRRAAMQLAHGSLAIAAPSGAGRPPAAAPAAAAAGAGAGGVRGGAAGGSVASWLVELLPMQRACELRLDLRVEYEGDGAATWAAVQAGREHRRGPGSGSNGGADADAEQGAEAMSGLLPLPLDAAAGAGVAPSAPAWWKLRGLPGDTGMAVHGNLYSPNCGFALPLGGEGVDVRRLSYKVHLYCALMASTAIVQIFLLGHQMLQAGDSADATSRISLLTLVQMALVDAYLFLFHLTLGLILDPLLWPLVLVAFLQFVLFAVLEMRYILLVMRAQRTVFFSQAPQVSPAREVGLLYTRFYQALLPCILFGYFLASPGAKGAPSTGSSSSSNSDVDAPDGVWGVPSSLLVVPLLLLVSGQYMTQIAHSVATNTRPPLSAGFTLCSSAARLVLPLYLLACPSNLLSLPPRPVAALLLLLLGAGQQLAMEAQRRWGARCLVPRVWRPARYDYHRRATAREEGLLGGSRSGGRGQEEEEEEEEEGAQGEEGDVEQGWGGGGRAHAGVAGGASGGVGSLPGAAGTASAAAAARASGDGGPDCVVCMCHVQLSPAHARMLTPCGHLFHEPCLRRWALVKLECPTCRSRLPPLDE